MIRFSNTRSWIMLLRIYLKIIPLANYYFLNFYSTGLIKMILFLFYAINLYKCFLFSLSPLTPTTPYLTGFSCIPQ